MKNSGVWNDINHGKLIVSKDIDPYNPFIYAMTLNDHTPNTMLITRAKTYNHFRFLIEQYRLGNVYYESQKIKATMQNILRYII